MRRIGVARGVIMIVAFVLMAGIYMAERYYRYTNSSFVEGILFYDGKTAPDALGDVPMDICYFVGNEEFKVQIYEYYEKGNVKVLVRYPTGSPADGEIYSVARFWLVPALWLIIPLMLTGAFLLTYFKPEDKLEIEIKNKNENKLLNQKNFFMKKNTFLSLALLLICGTTAIAQTDTAKKEEGYVFTTVKEIPVTSVKDQHRAGTCWCYSGLGFIEAELIRMGKGEYDLSEMYIVHNTYIDRARAAVRTHGDVSFSQGGSFYDVIYGMKTFGLVPEAEMRPGAAYGDTLSDHSELSAVSDAVVNAIAKGKLKKLQSKDGEMLWEKAIKSIHDAYLGECPEKFVYNGVSYTPMSFYESLGLNADDYVSITSYTHHPFYEKFVLEIQDNWRWSQCYNLPLDEMMQVFDNAIENGYTIAWGSDVSEEGFRNNIKKGFCVLPDLEAKNAGTGSDMAHWTGLSVSDRKKEAQNKPTPQRLISQEERQEAYDNWETTDDHGMLIYGTATDQTGNEYYMVKNSWGDYGEYHGMFYVSKAFARYKTMNIVVHKDALPKDIKKKLGIK